MADVAARRFTTAIRADRAIAAGTLVLLTALGAQVEIPHSPVPYTLQTLFVLLSGALLGPSIGAGAMAAYVVAGVIGVPVFSGWGAGIARILGPTGGYLLAFPAAAFVVGYLSRGRNSFWACLLSMFVGLLVIFSAGTLQLNLVLVHDWSKAFAQGFLIFSWWDLVKLAAAASIARAVGKRFAGSQGV